MRSHLLPRLIALSCLLPMTARSQGQPACDGRWTGTIEVPGTPLAFETRFAPKADGSCGGTISIAAQGATNVPLSDVVMRADSARFTIAGVPGTPSFSGARAATGRAMAGTFTQGSGRFPFRMAVAAAAEEAAAALVGLDAWVDSALVSWKAVGVSIGITVDGETVYLKGHGMRDRERKLPVTPQTLFAIGSSSKAFTTFAMGALVDQGKLQWDLPVTNYLPWFRMNAPAVTARITSRDLVTHRSGLPRHDLLWYNNATMSRDEIVRRIAYLPLNKDLRETFQYNNLMFLTAGYLVGTLTGSTWENGLQQLVLDPLGMKRTNFSVQTSRADADHAEPYGVYRDTITHLPFRDISLVGPAGSINSSAEDMLKWASLHIAGGKLGDRQVVQAATLRDMYKPYTPITGMGDDAELGPMSYGLGWFVDTYRGHYRAQHGGNIDGFTAAVTLLPRDRVGIVVLVNQNGSALGEVISRHVMDRVFGTTRRDWNAEALARSKAAAAAARLGEQKKEVAMVPGTTPSHALRTYAATYADSGYGNVSIAIERDTLSVSYNGISAKLRHWHYDTFSALRNPLDPTFENMQVTFRASPSGRVDALEMKLEPNVPAIRFLRQPDARLRDVAFLERLTGRYQIPGGPIATVLLRGATLVWSQPGGTPTPLEPRDGTTFVLASNSDISVEFKLDTAGAATGARVVQPGAVTDVTRVP